MSNALGVKGEEAKREKRKEVKTETLFVRPRPPLWRTPVDVALLGFFTLTFLTALTSYDPEVSIGKLRAASLFTVVYVTSQNVRSPRLLRALALTLVASCALGLVHTFAAHARGRGV